MIALAIAAALSAAADRADRLRLAGALAPAMDVANAELEQGRAVMDRRREAWALDVMGRVLDDQGRGAEGRARQEDARALARDLGDRGLEARIVADMGFGHWKRAEYDDARRLCEEALGVQVAIGDDEGRALTLSYLGRIAFKLGDGAAAMALFERALVLEEVAGNRHAQVETREDLGFVHLEARRYRDAFEEFALGLGVAKTLEDSDLVCQMLVDTGILHLFQGDASRSEVAFRSALSRAEASESEGWRASARSHLARALGREGRDEEALREAVACTALREGLGDPRAMAWDLALQASLEAKLGRDDRALESYLRALDLWEGMADRRASAWHLLEVARLYARLGDAPQSLAMFARCLDLSAQIQLPYASLAMGEVGILHARLGHGAEALAWGARAIEEAERVGNAEMQTRALHDRARILDALGRPEEALGEIEAAADLIEMLRGQSVPDPSARVAVLEEKQGVYADGVRLLWDLGRPEDALAMAERARGRAILDVLASRENGASVLVAAPAATLAEMRAEARASHATFVVYYFAGPRLLIWAIDPRGEVHSASSPIAAKEILAMVDGLRDSIPEGIGADALADLFKALVAPVERWLPRDPEEVVTVIPHGPLFYVSFAALRDARGRCFVESHALCYEPAIGIAPLLDRRRPGGAPRILLVGNPVMPVVPGRELMPLPAAEDEARSVAGLYPHDQATLLVGVDASERHVRQLVTGRTCIHFATHAVLRDDEPLQSMVALAPGSDSSGTDGDGLLTAEEILDMRLDADLVTLSACETGLGRVTGDGMIGLCRSFLGAGAASVIASLWRVADVSTRFQMERFYSELGKGVPKARALRHAQIATRDALRKGAIRTQSGRVLPDTAFFWAPFVLVGDPGR